MKTIRNPVLFLLAMLVLIMIVEQPVKAASSKTYKVTANLYVPGKLNTQLPGITAYLTNGNNPLGLGGYKAVAPTEAVYDNASLTVAADGTVTLDLHIPNPVFTLQKIDGSSNATIVNAVRDNETYGTVDGSVTREGRITNISVELHDQSGIYVFTDCIEFPTLLGLDWTVALTLEVDLSDVDFEIEQETATVPSATAESNKPATATPKPNVSEPSKPATAIPAKGDKAAESLEQSNNNPPQTVEVNYDKLNAVISTVNKELANAVVSKDGSDVNTANVWVAQSAVDSLSRAKKTAEASLTAVDQQSVDAASDALTTAYAKFIHSQKSGAMLEVEEEVQQNRELAAGTYTVSANIWFNKADTGLPLNPHITNSTFPPYNPVSNNALLLVADDGSAKLTIPVTIQDKVMTVRSISDLNLTDTKKNEEGAITEIIVDMGQLSGSRTVVTQKIRADIEMGDLAMSISGLDKEHTWPAIFELNLSGIATRDGGAMPTIALTLMNDSEAGTAMASVTREAVSDAEQTEVQTAGQVQDQNEDKAANEVQTAWSKKIWILVLTVVVIVAAILTAVVAAQKRKHNTNK